MSRKKKSSVTKQIKPPISEIRPTYFPLTSFPDFFVSSTGFCFARVRATALVATMVCSFICWDGDTDLLGCCKNKPHQMSELSSTWELRFHFGKPTVVKNENKVYPDLNEKECMQFWKDAKSQVYGLLYYIWHIQCVSRLLVITKISKHYASLYDIQY